MAARNGVVKSATGEVANLSKKAGRNRFIPDPNATGAHSVFRKDLLAGKTSHYETYRIQENPFNPKPWESVLRFDGIGKPHRNKFLKEFIETPHIHDPLFPGVVRKPVTWEIP